MTNQVAIFQTILSVLAAHRPFYISICMTNQLAIFYISLTRLATILRKPDNIFMFSKFIVRCVCHSIPLKTCKYIYIILLYFSGPPGKPGKPGPRGSPGLNGNTGGVTGGAVYTRWGRKSCPTTSQTTKLYSGMMQYLNTYTFVLTLGARGSCALVEIMGVCEDARR